MLTRRPLLFAALALLLGPGGVAAIEPLPGETAMAAHIRDHPEQGRAQFTYHEVLNFIARAKAADMAKRAFFSHVDPDGFGPNFAAHTAGYKLPYSVAPTANSIESIGVRHQNNLTPAAAAQMVFNSWLDSPPHRVHILGKTGFEAQTFYGVGYAFAQQGPFGWSSHYFVFVSAPPDPEARLTPFIEWQFQKMSLKDLAHPASDPDGDGFSNPWEYALDWNPLAGSEKTVSIPV